MIQNSGDQRLAEADGFRTTRTPQPPAYPQNWVEIDFSRGSQYRRVLIRNPSEEQLFKENVNLSDWSEDSEPPALAGTPVSLSDSVAEATRGCTMHSMRICGIRRRQRPAMWPRNQTATMWDLSRPKKSNNKIYHFPQITPRPRCLR